MRDEIRIKTKRISVPAPGRPAEAAPLGVGSIIDGRYRLSRSVSRDQDCHLFLGTHLHLGRTVEVKLLVGGVAKTQRRFFREGRILSLLRHRNIVDVHDMGISDAGPYIVLEHLDGAALGDVMAKRGPLSVHHFQSIANQVLAALECAHERQVVHRGVSPDSVIVVNGSEPDGQVKLTGFGTSGRLGENSSSVTRSSPIIDASSHFAPEQLVEREGADERTDVYAAGILFYRMLTGTTPFVAKTVAGLIGKILGEPPRPASDHRPELSAELDALLLRCLDKQPDKRFGGIPQLRRALDEALDEVSSPDRDTIPPSI